jgi:hypothetical protein
VRRSRSRSRDRRDDRDRKRRTDDVRETEDSRGREKKEKDSEREKSMEIEKVKEKELDKHNEKPSAAVGTGDIEDGEIYEKLPVEEKPKPNGSGPSSTAQEINKKSEVGI